MNQSKTLFKKLKKIKAVIFDGDGVLFTGRVFIHPKDGEFLKERSHIDGQGISLLRAIGIKIALISGETTGFLEKIGEKLNNLPSVKEGKWAPIAIFTGPKREGKVKAIENWLKENNLSWQDCAVMGDDLTDYHLLKKVGFSAAPAQAEEIIKKSVDWVTKREGGKGAIRDFANLLLKAKRVNPLKLPLR